MNCLVRYSEEHILAMIARITPIPGLQPKPRRMTLRGVAQGVVFIQRIRYDLLPFTAM